MQIVRRPIDLRDAKVEEHTNALAAKNEANLEYIAMMADIEIPTDNESIGGEQ